MRRVSSRRIHVIGNIGEESYREFSEKLAEFEQQSNTPIIVELNSGGGTAYDALAFSARMRNSPCDIIVHAYGLVASAAVLILAAGDKRLLARDAWVMVHEDSGKWKGSVTDIEREGKHYRNMENQWYRLLKDCTGTTAEVWQDLHKRSCYLTAQECLMLKLATELM